MNHIKNLFALYSEPHRHYHTFNHIVRMLEMLAIHAIITPKLYTAVLYHDAIYHPKKDDNELQSAYLYEIHSVNMGEKPDAQVIQMIIDTKEHIPTIEESKLLIDADLWVLGSNIHIYSDYKQALKKEYEPFFTKEEMIAGRTAFLENMLDKENIFYTPNFQRCYTHTAKINLEFELKQLRDKTSDWDKYGLITPDLRRPPFKGIIKRN